MLTMVEVRTSQGTVLSLPLEDVSDGLIIESIDGLDPVKATLVSSSFARRDGEQYQSSRRESRNIKFRLVLEPDYVVYSVEDLRKRLYEFLMPKSAISLRFYTSDGLRLDILGRVETFETALFTKDPAVDISIMCFDPDFYNPDASLITGVSTGSSAETILTYDGSIETGFVMTLDINRSVSEITIYHRPPDGTLRSLEFSAPLTAGDVLKISTISGGKGATLMHLGTETSVLYAVSPQSNWIELMPGDNNFRVYAEGVGFPYSIDYTTKYGGL